jgi:hypothetical protein
MLVAVISLFLSFAAAIPQSSPSVQCNRYMTTYTIQSGDTCTTIAQANGMTLVQFSEKNNNPNCDSLLAGNGNDGLIKIGSTLCVPCTVNNPCTCDW